MKEDITNIKQEIKSEIDAIVFRASTDLQPIVEDAENYLFLDDVENNEELYDYFDNVIYNLDNAISDLNDILEKYEELWKKYCL